MENSVRLTDQQREAIQEIDRNLQIIACAGSGKTEVITRRIANILQSKSDITPQNIVAFTFTEKAADSMKRRIVKALNDEAAVEGMYIGTIHGFCYHLLNKYTEQFKGHKILDTVKSHLFVARYHNECGMSDLKLDPYPRNVNLFLSCIEKMIDDYDNHEQWSEEHKAVFEKYKNSLYSRGYIDFALLIFEAIEQLRNNELAKQFLQTIKYLVVDEYQDVDDLQEKLVSIIVDAGANVCVVGDDDQTIYQFRGSNANNMISFPERYHDVHQVRLETNFRCSHGVVDIADCVIRNNDNRIAKKMIANGDVERTEIVARRFDSRADEYAWIAEKAAELHQSGTPYKEIAILVRKGKYINAIASVINKNGIPFSTDSADHFFSGEYFGKFVTTLNILADVDKAKLYECWHEYADDRQFSMAFKYLRSCARGGNYSLSEVIIGFCEKIDFLNESAEDYETRKIDVDGIVKILDDYDEIYRDWQLSARITGILKFLGTQAAEEYKYHSFKPKDPNEDAVQLMTVHKAKGLEFHSVFLPELTKREFPVSNMGGKQYWHVLGGAFEENKGKYRGGLEDERKLFYVAVTRAKRNLYLSYELSSQPVSMFVTESASSTFLTINREDLRFNPKADDSDFAPIRSSSYASSEEKEEKVDWEEERRQRQEYWATVKYAKSQLYDYYGTGAHFCPAMYSMLGEIKRWSPEQILEEASRNGLI